MIALVGVLSRFEEEEVLDPKVVWAGMPLTNAELSAELLVLDKSDNGSYIFTYDDEAASCSICHLTCSNSE